MSPHPDFIEQLKQLFQKQYGEPPQDYTLLPASGSDRRYVRFTKKDGTTVIGAYNPDRSENNTFFYFSRIFAKYQLPVPGIIATGQNKQTYLLEDAGTSTLYDILATEGHTDRVKELFKKAIDQLVRFHWQAGPAVDYSMCFAANAFDEEQICSDLLYFKYYFADLLQVKYNKNALLEEMREWSSDLAAGQPRTFMYRDFQSRNIIVKNENVYFVDYQGGMSGLPEYDLASLLWQARAELPERWKEELLNYYFQALEAIPEKSGINETSFRKTYLKCVLLRMLQTLGAYGFRGLIQQKELFIKSIGPALQQLSGFLQEYGQTPPYNEFRKLLKALVRPEVMERFSSPAYTEEQRTQLQVTIYSFSYKKGLPADETAHGGGYVFDCRGILNPGREKAYQQLTGKDKPVMDYLAQKTKMPEFLKGVYATVDISVDNYLERGFQQLSVAFGCTGGQHRSVYAAEALKRHLQERFHLNPTVIHLEQEDHSVKRLA